MREFYKAPEGDFRPTKKGLNLDAEAMATLLEHIQVRGAVQRGPYTGRVPKHLLLCMLPNRGTH